MSSSGGFVPFSSCREGEIISTSAEREERQQTSAVEYSSVSLLMNDANLSYGSPLWMKILFCSREEREMEE